MTNLARYFTHKSHYFSNPFDQSLMSILCKGLDVNSFGMYGDSHVINMLMLDVCENENEYIVTADVPGIDETAISVKVEGLMMHVMVDVSSDNQDERNNYLVRERNVGRLYRTIKLASSFDSDNVTATLNNGVLTISAPKLEDNKVKDIALEVL
ncbi:MAG: hypothetical protein CMQ51_03215 [Gammaproteobacteria bacterium]|nr:hypothetical protein [Gammaproteobacteria bacterium]HAJ06429.1 hypothetical protein [Chloroflexota bacterium]HCU99080.1 hypothetical protein [Chloroflexota bacterium]|tara:strand:+ start:615 stop:1076 length:462 start_codon:yes stop_codon:yes gene_type:complete